MTDHLQQTMPEHLKKYQGGDTYIPEHIQTEMAKHLESTLPTHMKQYAGAYMQQNVVGPSLAGHTSAAGGSSSPQPAPSVSPVAFSGPVVGTGAASEHPSPSPAIVTGGNSAGPSGPEPPKSPDQPYDFITNAPQEPRKPLLGSLPGSGSTIGRIGLIAAALIVLVIVFAIFKNLLSSKPNLDYFVTIVQQQQEMIHLTSNATQVQGISTGNMNFATTVQASLTSSQAQTIQYLTTNHKKIKTKQLNLKVSAATDTQLSNAQASATYNQTFQEVMQAQMNAYGNTLQQAYKLNPGPHGKALLKDEYRQLQLFETQLKTPAN